MESACRLAQTSSRVPAGTRPAAQAPASKSSRRALADRPVPTGAQRTLDRFLRDAAACAGNRHAGNADRKQARPTNIRDEFRADDLRVLQPGSASTIGVNPWGWTIQSE